MHIVIVGATGRIGRRVLDLALRRGDRVTAIVRDPHRLAAAPGLQVVVGDVLDEKRTWKIPADVNAVVFAVGSRGTGSTVVRSDGMANLLDAVPPGVRIVALSSAGVEISRNISIVRRLALRFLVQKRLRNILNDMERMEDELTGRGDDWTLVRCTNVRDGGVRGVAISKAGCEVNHAAVCVDDVARFVLDDAVTPQLTRSAVTLAGAS